MQYSDFERQVERLRVVYSAASLNAERIKVLWDKFKTDRADIFEKVVTHMIAEFTTQQLPAMSRFVEAAGLFRTNPEGAAWMMQLAPVHACEKCRDFGFYFAGHLVSRCECDRGSQVNPERLAREQKNYDKGRRLFCSPFDKGMPPPTGERIFPALPYNANERIQDKSGEWV